MTTLAPSAAKRRTAAEPIAPAPPVTSAILSVKRRPIMLFMECSLVFAPAVARLEAEWWPQLRTRYADAQDMTAADRDRIAAIMRPHRDPPDIVAAYPAHIHMNLLPRLRGQRVGSRLLEMWVDQARQAGVTGIHLGASPSNAGGIAFWGKSFERLREEGAVWFGMHL